MARGWESKSVEQQIEERDQFTGPLRNAHEDAARERELEVLKLARLRLLLRSKPPPARAFAN